MSVIATTPRRRVSAVWEEAQSAAGARQGDETPALMQPIPLE